jgi:urease accessory protein
MASHSHDHQHSHEGHASHSHAAGGDHGHTHEILDGPGSFLGREMPIVEGRNFEERAFTVGIGGYVPALAWSIGMFSQR